MCAAIECLTRTGYGKKDWDKVIQVLGKELKEDLYGTKEDSSTGLRHRLSHGEYFSAEHSAKNYVELIHAKVMEYFNDHIFKARLLDSNVVSPQRHFSGTHEGGSWFIKSKKVGGLSLKKILLDFDKNDVNHLEDHELVHDDALRTNY